MLIQPPHQVAGLAGTVGVYESFRALARRISEAATDLEGQISEVRDSAVALQDLDSLTPQEGSAGVDGIFVAGEFGAAAGTATFVLPLADGTAGQYLKTDGAGNLSFGSISSFVRLQASTPGTSDTGHANLTGTVLAGKFGKTGGVAQFVLPNIDGSNGQVMKTDGFGNLSLGYDDVLFSGTRSLAAAVNSITEMGSFASSEGAASLVIHTLCETTGSTIAKTFGVNSVYFSGTSTYYAATPIGNRAVGTNDYEVDVVTSNKVTTLRLRRNATDGATVLSVFFTVTGTLGASPVVTSLSGTGTASLPLTGCHNAGGPVQVGAIVAFPGAAAPAGYLLCDGAAVSRSTYARLFSISGGGASPFGTGDGSTTFNVPNIAGPASGVVYIIRH